MSGSISSLTIVSAVHDGAARKGRDRSGITGTRPRELFHKKTSLAGINVHQIPGLAVLPQVGYKIERERHQRQPSAAQLEP
jgi:hypothetical protein